MGNNTENHESELFYEALLKGSRREGSAIALKHTGSKEEIIRLYENIMKPALYKVGDMWEYNIISVAAEHLATSVSEAIMNEIYYDIISTERVSKKIVLGCVENEYHQVGIKMIADVFEMNGWDTFFLGANIPTDEFIDFCKTHTPNLIALSLSIYSHLPMFEKMILKVRENFPNIHIIVGGQAFIRGGEKVVRKHANTTLINSLNDLEQFIQKINNHDTK